MRKELELIKNCTPENRAVMTNSLKKMNEAHTKAIVSVFLGVLIFLGGLLVIVQFKSPFGVIGLISGFYMIIGTGVSRLKNVGLI